MKKITRLLIAFAMLFIAACAYPPVIQARTVYNCDALTGGAARALDSYAVGDLSDADTAIVCVGAHVYFFRFDATATAAEQSTAYPRVIRPDDYASAGNWEEYAPDVDISSLTNLAVGNYLDLTDDTISMDPTEIGNVTWGSGSDTTWTFHTSGTSPYITFGNATITIGGITGLTMPSYLLVRGTESANGILYLYADDGDDNADRWQVKSVADGEFQITSFSTGSWVAKLALDTDSEFSMSNNDAGTYNTIFGKNAGDAIEVGANYNCFFGEDAGTNVTTGDYNIGIGYQAFETGESGSDNIAIGHTTLGAVVSGDGNIAIGSDVLTAAEDSYNIGVGYHALELVSTGTGNIGIGYSSGLAITTGGQNVALGYEALLENEDGSNNIAIGTGAGEHDDAGADATSPDNCVIIGAEADFDSTTPTNEIVIGYNADGNGDNTVTLGNTDISEFHCEVALTVDSDRRIKRDINPTTAGLDFINDLDPIIYKRVNPADYPKEIRKWKDGEKRPVENENVYIGLIAQEVEKVMEKHGLDFSLVKTASNGKKSITYESLIMPLINALQELSKRVEALEAAK